MSDNQSDNTPYMRPYQPETKRGKVLYELINFMRSHSGWHRGIRETDIEKLDSILRRLEPTP